jgi:hypothetical protein
VLRFMKSADLLWTVTTYLGLVELVPVELHLEARVHATRPEDGLADLPTVGQLEGGGTHPGGVSADACSGGAGSRVPGGRRSWW